MSRYRRISVGMWSSPDFLALSAPDPNARDLFVHLLTGQHTTAIPGLFSAGKARLAEDLRWPVKAWEKCFAEIESRGMVAADWDARVVWLPRAIAHNTPESLNVVKSWRRAWDEIPPCSLRSQALHDLYAFLSSWQVDKREAFREAFRVAFREAIPEAFAEGIGEARPGAIGEALPEAYEGPSGIRAPVHARGRAAPYPALWSGQEGVQGEPEASPVGAVEGEYLRALREAGVSRADVGDPSKGARAGMSARWEDAKAAGVEWPAFCAALRAEVAEWVTGVRAGHDQEHFLRGWDFSKLGASLRKIRAAKSGSGKGARAMGRQDQLTEADAPWLMNPEVSQ